MYSENTQATRSASKCKTHLLINVLATWHVIISPHFLLQFSFDWTNISKLLHLFALHFPLGHGWAVHYQSAHTWHSVARSTQSIWILDSQEFKNHIFLSSPPSCKNEFISLWKIQFNYWETLWTKLIALISVSQCLAPTESSVFIGNMNQLFKSSTWIFVKRGIGFSAFPETEGPVFQRDVLIIVIIHKDCAEDANTACKYCLCF